MTTSSIQDSEVRKLAEFVKSHGWRVDQTETGRPRFWPPDRTKAPIIASGRSGDYRAVHNLKSELKRAGLPLHEKVASTPEPAASIPVANVTPVEEAAPSKLKIPFHLALRDARRGLGLTQDNFASIVGLPRTNIISLFETNGDTPTREEFELLCKAVPELRDTDCSLRAERVTRGPLGPRKAKPPIPPPSNRREALRMLQDLAGECGSLTISEALAREEIVLAVAAAQQLLNEKRLLLKQMDESLERSRRERQPR